MLVKPKKIEKQKRITLTSKEISELLAEAIVTIVLLLLLNVSIMFLLGQLLSENSPLAGVIWATKDAVAKELNTDLFWSWNKFVLPIFFLVDAAVLYWRLIRRYHQMQLRHIISELHYISDGNYNHRIPFELSGDLAKVVTSINGLVDSTVAAIEDERRIEKSKDELITNVSHDIRTPLTSIIGYLGLIEDRQFHSQEDLLKYTHTAYVKAKQMKLLVDDLFEYTKVRQPSVPIHTTTFDMVQLIEQLAADFELEAKKINMQIQVKANPASLMMEGDTEKLVRVFNNLLSNALKYGKGGHHIVMEVDKVGTEAIIAVRNDGPAIPKHSLDQLFDRFYRVEESRSQETGGTGLGLAIAQSIVALHGGYIYAKSDQKWTSFIIHLPLQRTNKKSES
ncbi:ATPase/histidine kinase/DNA gyrase B/HSP90 domain protein [Enterococcus faecalis ERV65]|uniref:histidine kinase n=1 Tax=Enterococcus faecalis ERV63 TaxID=1134793 RepID=A0AAV3GNY5_ENTFL|nr:HAMP domain-containing sensor histidine kinase [Enterococcus faecalis]EEI12360.1 ATPase/histidine kinase/DNA gyrase B/HSP90 domain protein [Enterococcus faecalis TX0104]EJU86839.1 ATPase/histidine kinase/DNA gyrase B/HSP90 domain protein [Enterococcus faecalis ERV103]EJU89082.1 ATPase/histidine kinase/DNA gyrase B/HSP90 domain protein [Enterococcus faecalis ERV116]EJV02469.1 ATPase/histidine kinase/DNA gyrase B/HSP90 domain protein [Enterococcus faecalis ERV25]EJV03659.1 ATPase/histidine ki